MFHMEQKNRADFESPSDFFICRCKKAVPNRCIPRCPTL